MLVAVVLAAGLGKRMKSRVPKMLQPVAGRPLAHFSIRAALDAGADRVVVVVSADTQAGIESHAASVFGPGRVHTVVQGVPSGTGDAARIAVDTLGPEVDRVLVLYGDTPLVTAATLGDLLAKLGGSTDLAIVACMMGDPAGYGRVVCDGERVVRVREEKDASPEEKAIGLVNAGVYAARMEPLRLALAGLRPTNAQGEYYLTDIVEQVARSRPVVAVRGPAELLVGVNDKVQLDEAEQRVFERIADRHRRAGATVQRGARIDDAVLVAEDARIEAGASLRGSTRIGAGTLVGVGSVVEDSTIGDGAVVKPYSVIVGSVVEARAQVGPFAHIRPGSHIEEEAHVGNFVETKKTRLGRGAKANHLAYLGDGDVGAGANIGAGTIFCNYDGFSKHSTVIGEGAFIGSDSQLVAPIRIGKGAYVATGTTVTKDVPDDALAISRTPQDTKAGYAPRLKARLSRASKKS